MISGNNSANSSTYNSSRSVTHVSFRETPLVIGVVTVVDVAILLAWTIPLKWERVVLHAEKFGAFTRKGWSELGIRGTLLQRFVGGLPARGRRMSYKSIARFSTASNNEAPLIPPKRSNPSSSEFWDGRAKTEPEVTADQTKIAEMTANNHGPPKRSTRIVSTSFSRRIV
jgi:hypothetical protein